jgi:hypothetical protein
MPELRSGARQARPPHPPSLVPAGAVCPETVPRRTTPRRRAAGVVVEEAHLRRNRVRTRAAVAKEEEEEEEDDDEEAAAEAAVVTRVGNPAKKETGSSRPIKQYRNNKNSPLQHRAAAGAGHRGSGRGKGVSPRSRSPLPPPVQYPSPLLQEENVQEDIDLVNLREAEAAEIRAMEEESAGRSADKVPGAEDDGSAAPLPERVNCLVCLLGCFAHLIFSNCSLCRALIVSTGVRHGQGTIAFGLPI